jgi:tRNA-dihydrouridine synthase A
MKESVSIPVTVKCRIGIEPREAIGDDYDLLSQFVSTVASAGCEVFIVHARKALLNGLSPKQNREIPPLRFDFAARLRADFPSLTLVVNGGIRTVQDSMLRLQQFDGVMLGREICDNPYRLAELHQATLDSSWRPSRVDVVDRYCGYMHARLSEGHRLAAMLRHALPLFAGVPRGRSWRRFISERASLPSTTPDVLREALRIVAPLSGEGLSMDVA